MNPTPSQENKRIEAVIVERATLEAERAPAVPDNGPALAASAATLHLVDPAAESDFPGDRAPETIALVSHTVAGVRSGLSAGCWVIGLALTGSLVDRPEPLPRGDQLAALLEKTGQDMARAGAHLVVDSLADLPWIIQEIDFRLAVGEIP